jgi:hypothetical protein
VHAVDAAHEIPESKLYRTPVGLGVDWIDQAVPFQDSASVTVLFVVEAHPTAVHAVGATHETPESELALAPEGPGTV